MMTALEVSAKPLSSLDLIVSEEGALCKTRGVIHLHPPCVSINCPGLSLSYCSPSITNLLWVALRSCSFSFLLLFQRGCAIASATLLLTLGHQGNLHPTGICTSSDGFEGNTKKLGVCEVQTNTHGKNKREVLNTTTLSGNVKTKN